jgi:hypothetical protein
METISVVRQVGGRLCERDEKLFRFIRFQFESTFEGLRRLQQLREAEGLLIKKLIASMHARN